MADPAPAALSGPAPAAAARPAAPRAPLDLPRQVMRRAGLLALGVLLLAVVLGLWRMGNDIEDEVRSAMTLAHVMSSLGQLAQQRDDPGALLALQAMQATHPLRHLALTVHAPDGRLLLGPPAEVANAPVLDALLALHRRWLSPPDDRQVSWWVPREQGGPWKLTLAASHESERRESMISLLGMLGLLLLCVVGLLLAMRWNVRQAFAPLGRLLDAIADIGAHGAQAARSLPPMPIGELESVAAALRHLGAALDAAEAQRRLLSQQMLTLQEDERARLARDLHDEFGQRLTALRVDAAWLARQLGDQPALKSVVDGMAQQCSRLQADIRSLLTRLQPFGPGSEGGAGSEGEPLARGVAQLRALVHSWQGVGREGGPACRLDLAWQDDHGRDQPWPDGALAETLWLPRSLWLALYRISQEALTNVARHAQANEVVLSLHVRGRRQPGQALHIDWQARDDGIGLPDPAAAMQRGNGLAGLQQRVWAQGSQLHLAPLHAGAARPGLRLQAGFDTRLLPGPAAHGASPHAPGEAP